MILLKFCGDPFKRCSLPPNKRIIPKKVFLWLIQAATSTFVLISQSKLRKWFLANMSQSNGVRSHKCIEVEYKSDYCRYFGASVSALVFWLKNYLILYLQFLLLALFDSEK